MLPIKSTFALPVFVSSAVTVSSTLASVLEELVQDAVFSTEIVRPVSSSTTFGIPNALKTLKKIDKIAAKMTNHIKVIPSNLSVRFEFVILPLCIIVAILLYLAGFCNRYGLYNL